MLPHALIVEVPRGADPVSAARAFTDKNDTIVEIIEHKKEKGTTIGIFIEDIRELQQLVRTAKPGARTIVIFADAKSMTHQAQNALLKLLEEPREGLHIILATTTSQTLLPTVRSRCQIVAAKASVSVEIPSESKARIEFMAGGSPDEQKRLVTDKRYYQQQERLFELAKQFVGGSSTDKLGAIQQVKESRDEALGLLHAALVLARFMIQKNTTKQIVQLAERLLLAEEALHKNGNVRLWLLTCVV